MCKESDVTLLVRAPNYFRCSARNNIGFHTNIYVQGATYGNIHLKFMWALHGNRHGDADV